ncbi:MAG: hypothetical protein CVU05_02220 [Bacteroidetes bacterium HGW-Bacteroidetes-21]|jgi:sensor histidine kinase YesM/Tfp pilus assembly protein PilF|nr:MAG: hypothetical protein CVU05_02220 [Bacteroidetes bacterium HGW-Bacteroidetes-21]
MRLMFSNKNFFRGIYRKKIISVLIILSLSSISSFGQNQAAIDSLLNIFTTSKQDTIKIETLLKLSHLYADNNPQKGLQISKKALLLADNSGNKKVIADCYNNIGLYNRRLGNYPEAAEYYQKALNVYRKIGKIQNEGNCYLNLGVLYGNQGDYQLALDYFQKSLKIGETNGDKDNVAFCLNNIGNIHLSLGNNSQALEYYQKALKINEELNIKYAMAICYSNIGAIYGAQKNHTKEIEYYTKSLKIDDELGDKNGLSSDYSNLGNAYLIVEDYTKAMEFSQKALKLSEETGDKNGIGWILSNIAKIEIQLGKYNEAIDYATRSLTIANEIGDLEVKKLACQRLSTSYEKLQNPSKALEFFKIYSLTQESLINVEKNNQITEMEARYQAGEKQQKIEKQTLELEKSNAEIKLQTTLKYAFIIGFGLMLLISLIIFRNFKNKKRTNAILSKQKHEIEEKNEELQVQNTEITKKRDEIEQHLKYTQKLQEALKHDLSHYMQLSLRKIINPHFIFNSLNSIQSFILQNEKLEASIYLSRFSELMRNVLDHSLKEFITLKEETDTLGLYLELESNRFEGRFSWNIHMDETLTPEKIWVPPLILQPFVENAIWHGLMPSEKEGKLTITIKNKGNTMLFSIEDNGIGREKSAFLNKTRKKRESHGIKITEERIKIINSLNNIDFQISYYDLKVEENTGIGTRIEFLLPLIQPENYD